MCTRVREWVHAWVHACVRACYARMTRLSASLASPAFPLSSPRSFHLSSRALLLPPLLLLLLTSFSVSSSLSNHAVSRLIDEQHRSVSDPKEMLHVFNMLRVLLKTNHIEGNLVSSLPAALCFKFVYEGIRVCSTFFDRGLLFLFASVNRTLEIVEEKRENCVFSRFCQSFLFRVC